MNQRSTAFTHITKNYQKYFVVVYLLQTSRPTLCYSQRRNDFLCATDEKTIRREENGEQNIKYYPSRAHFKHSGTGLGRNEIFTDFHQVINCNTTLMEKNYSDFLMGSC